MLRAGARIAGGMGGAAFTTGLLAVGAVPILRGGGDALVVGVLCAPVIITGVVGFWCDAGEWIDRELERKVTR